MGYHNKLLGTLLCACFLVLSLSLNTVNCEPLSSCAQTPYPDTCIYFMRNSVTMSSSSLEKDTPFKFHDMALRVTMNQAVQVHSLVSSVDMSLLDSRTKLAWKDCIELYEDTMHQLNRSMSSNTVNSHDSQTWLSAAITNHVTCQNGFKELNIESSTYLKRIPSLMLSNFSELLSNSLAINKAYVGKSRSSSAQLSNMINKGNRRLLSDGLPSWLSASDRKLLQTGAPKADVVVAKDGSGNYKTISEAVAASSKLGKGKRFVIYVKAGIYNENVDVKRSMKNVMIFGDGKDATVVTGNRNAQDGSTTFRSATFAVMGEGFIARDMTFQNTAGPQKHQAVALRSGSDFSVFYGCSFKGYQDTLYVYAMRQFYRDCDIYGTVDFIFGNAVAVLQNCNIYGRKPGSGQFITVTAQARTDPNQNTGIVIQGCRIAASSDLKAGQGSVKAYLGRPWQKFSRTVIMKSSIDSFINPQGWLPWSGSFALNTLYYAEYMNTGPGAGTGGRVKWPGYHVITSAADAGKFTVGNFLAGNSWLPATGVPFSAGL